MDRYDDTDYAMVLCPLDRVNKRRLAGCIFLQAAVHPLLEAPYFTFFDADLRTKTSLVFQKGELYISAPYGEGLDLADFYCLVRDTVI